MHHQVFPKFDSLQLVRRWMLQLMMQASIARLYCGKVSLVGSRLAHFFNDLCFYIQIMM